jgi:membrane dipeptidase
LSLPQYLPINEYLKLPLEERLKRTLPLSKNDEDRASELREKLLFIDIHNHVVQQTYPRFPRERIIESGLNCLFESVSGHQDYNKTVQNLGSVFSVIDENKDLTRRVFSADDIVRAKREGKVAFVCDMEVQAVGAILDNVNLFHGLGVRGMGLTGNTRNFIGDGFEEETNIGLNHFGLQVVDRMNRLGMMISLAHAGLKTSYDTVAYSRDPVTLSHNATSVSFYNTSRPDELLKACAEKGGIIGLPTLANTLPNMKKTIEERRRVGIWDVLEHVEHAVEVVGIDHVGIGSDNATGVTAAATQRPMEVDRTLPAEGRVWYGPRPMTPISEHALLPTWKAKDPNWPYAVYTEGLNGISEWQNITRGLISRGYSNQEIAKIVGENALAFVKRVIG